MQQQKKLNTGMCMVQVDIIINLIQRFKIQDFQNQL